MPLSEFYRMSSQQKPTSTSADLSHLPDNNEIMELVWENDQIVMQGQSSRARKDSHSNNFQSHVSKFGERDLGNASTSKAGNGLMGANLDDFTATVPSSDLGLDRDDDMAHWLNYDEPLHNNYSSGFLPELSSVTLNDLPHDKKNIFNPTFDRNLPIGQSLRSGVSNAITNSVDYVGPTNAQASSNALSSSSSGIINFSYFTRPVALARANARNVSTVATAGSSGVEKPGLVSNVNFTSGLEKPGFVNKVNFVPTSNDMGSTTRPNLLLKMLHNQNTEKPENVLREDGVRSEAPPQQVDGAVASKGMGEGEKAMEPVVASSSMCSGNNPEQGSDDRNHNLKRKGRETDDSEGRSEDVEEESVGIRKTASARGGSGSKRSRAAEVHNLSERRRRDRINEKMRALQELIPNCNKVDKASMLDEAIEYLKTLQLQVQIMSMGAGVYMPHMMLPAGLPSHMGHFPPMMGVGMGMGMGFGMGMDRFHGPRAMPYSGPPNYQMMPGPNLQVFGPGIPVSAPHQPSVPISVGPTNEGANELVQNQLSLTKDVNEGLPS